MPSRTLTIADFDRTLFDPAFYQAFIQLTVHRGLLQPAAAEPVMASLHDTSQTTDLLSAIRMLRVDTDAAMETARAAFAPDQFLYPDATAFLKRAADGRLIIVTTAAGRHWQNFKLSLCPALHPFPQIVISGNKGQFIKKNLVRREAQLGLRHLPGEWFDRIMLVDDRTDALEPLVGESSLELWHVERLGAKYQRTRNYAGIHHVSTLNEVPTP
jgi:FMN phosphatase YigB (HAD superfamily)